MTLGEYDTGYIILKKLSNHRTKIKKYFLQQNGLFN
jgi:hypothetical protein